MKLIELGKKWLTLDKSTEIQIWEGLQKDMFYEIENCVDLDELKTFIKLNANFTFPEQITVKSFEKRLELGDNSPEALNIYQLFLAMMNVPLVYQYLQKDIFDKLTQLRIEDASEIEYEELRKDVLKKIKSYPRLDIYFS